MNTPYLGHSDYVHGSSGSTGILICNLGTPDAPTKAALRRYLGEFLADPRVVETPRWLWRLILHGVILRIRPARSARSYHKVWTEQGSPLLVHSQQQLAALQTELQDYFPQPVHIVLGMRYGNPSIPTALQSLHKAQVQRLLVLPLYPQYSATTTATVFDAVADELKSWRWIPELRFIQHYHDFPPYLAAMQEQIQQYQQEHGQAERLLFSFHGLPQRYLLKGDPYHCECHKTGRLLREALGLTEETVMVTFQSRFGREPWLQPYTDKTLIKLAEQGVKKVRVFCPGFAADCLETLEEIAMENRDIFLAAGGESLEYIPALNAMPAHIAALATLIKQHTQGWESTALLADPNSKNRAEKLMQETGIG